MINKSGLELIKSFETFSPFAIDDGYSFLVIGWRHIIKADEMAELTYYSRTNKIPLSIAERLLGNDLYRTETFLKEVIRVKLTENQFSSLVSFVYSIGEYNFSKSTMLKLINLNNKFDAKKEFEKWIFINGRISDELRSRRKKEAELFCRR